MSPSQMPIAMPLHQFHFFYSFVLCFYTVLLWTLTEARWPQQEIRSVLVGRNVKESITGYVIDISLLKCSLNFNCSYVPRFKLRFVEEEWVRMKVIAIKRS